MHMHECAYTHSPLLTVHVFTGTHAIRRCKYASLFRSHVCRHKYICIQFVDRSIPLWGNTHTHTGSQYFHRHPRTDTQPFSGGHTLCL